MLAGEPPHTGATAHAVIAKLLTERPVSLRNVRSSVAPALDLAVARALEKVPGDRFRTAGEFARALDAARAADVEAARALTGAAPPATAGGHAPTTRRRAYVVGGAAGVVVLAAATWLVLGPRERARTASLTFRSHTQLTFSGTASRPALSADGTQIAYVVQTCAAAGCTEGLEVQDVDGTAARRLLDGAEKMDFLAWSPDRRFLLFAAQLGPKVGEFLISTLGGAPRYLGPGPRAAFLSTDSLVVTEGDVRDTVGWAKTETVDGTVHDSVRLHGFGGGGWAKPFPAQSLDAGPRGTRGTGKPDRRSEWRAE